MFEFNEYGNIVEGIHQTTIDEYWENLVLKFEGSFTRRRNWDAFERILVPFLIKYNEHIDTIWLDGSFNSKKKNPRDIDGCIFLDIQPTESDLQVYCQFRNDYEGNHDYFKRNFCDFYPLISLKSLTRFQNSPNIKIQELGNSLIDNHYYWRDKFGFDRESHPKGIFEVKIGGTK